MTEVAVRELNQQTGRVLRRVEAGESMVVTDHGRPVAMLVPVPKSKFAQLRALGQVTQARSPGPELTPVTAVKRERSSEEILAELREEKA